MASTLCANSVICLAHAALRVAEPEGDPNLRVPLLSLFPLQENSLDDEDISGAMQDGRTQGPALPKQESPRAEARGLNSLGN